MSVKHGLLVLLAEEPRHGYALKTEFEERTGGAWALNIGQVYTTLARLERDGLVHSIGPDAEGRQRYRITRAGRRALDAWFKEPVEPEAPPRDELAIKLLLAVGASHIDVTRLIERQRAATVEQLQRYTRQKAHGDDDLAFVLLLDALILKAQAEIQWLDMCEARLRAGGGSPGSATRSTGGAA